jgi:DNA-directed RNA polymerase specialized sigma24 family protein
MDFDTATTDGAAALLKSYVSGERGRALRVQLAARYPECSDEEIEDAVQGACQCFLDEADDISEPGKAYAWLRTAAHRILGHDAKRQHREVPMDPAVGGRLESVAIDKTGPVEELIALEDDADLDALVRVVTTSLSDRRRDVLALYGVGLERTQIAERLGLPERTVKRDIREIVDRARSVVTRLAGGGCQRGEPLVVRLVCGISTPDESAQAREHLSRCGRCEAFCERLSAWREKAGAMLPAPVAEGASPGVLGRLAHKTTDGLSSLKQHVLDGGAQIKQHAATTYYRAVDPTPLAAARPGTVGAVIASCVAIGGGATYCAHQGIVDSIGAAAAGLIASESEDEPKPATTPPGAESTGPEYTPAEPPAEEAPAPEPTSEPPPSEPHHERPKVEAPPEDSFEPVAPSYTGGEAEPEAYEPPPAEPAPVPAGSPPQFGGP